MVKALETGNSTRFRVTLPSPGVSPKQYRDNTLHIGWKGIEPSSSPASLPLPNHRCLQHEQRAARAHPSSIGKHTTPTSRFPLVSEPFLPSSSRAPSPAARRPSRASSPPPSGLYLLVSSASAHTVPPGLPLRWQANHPSRDTFHRRARRPATPTWLPLHRRRHRTNMPSSTG
jgi:hypothetical protein